MAQGVTLTPEAHRERAAEHRRVGESLLGSSEVDWGCVAMFYAAYHLVRAALLEDPIFDDYEGLRRIDLNLTRDARYTTAHHGRRREPGHWGVNELVLKLYRPIVQMYERLHQASIDVRYGRGFAGEAADITSAFAAVRDAYEAGQLKAHAPAATK